LEKDPIENKIPAFTWEEHERTFTSSNTLEVTEKLMAAKGLKLNSGVKKVLINGEERFMDTSEKDLGTIIDPANLDERFQEEHPDPSNN